MRIIFARFIGEETVSCSNSLPELTDAPTWFIDPIDGTTNFVHSFPHTCISIALAVNKQLEIGIIYNPVLEQLFTARKGHGAFLNQKPIKSSNVEGEKHTRTHTHTLASVFTLSLFHNFHFKRENACNSRRHHRSSSIDTYILLYTCV